LPCFMDAMNELGYVDGKNVSFEFRFAAGDYRKLPALATELVSLRPDVIYTSGAPGPRRLRTRRPPSRSSSVRRVRQR
jgi:hypothetical protein